MYPSNFAFIMSSVHFSSFPETTIPSTGPPTTSLMSALPRSCNTIGGKQLALQVIVQLPYLHLSLPVTPAREDGFSYARSLCGVQCSYASYLCPVWCRELRRNGVCVLRLELAFVAASGGLAARVLDCWWSSRWRSMRC